MSKIKLLYPIVILILFVSFLGTTGLKAQNNANIQGSLDVWTSPIMWAGSYEIIPITIDTQGIKAEMTDVTEISNFTLTTSCGEVEFDDNIDGTDSTRYITASLSTQLECSKLTIMRATGKLDGAVVVDMTKNISVSDNKPVPIELLNSNSNVPTSSDQSNSCPNKTLSSGVVEGAFVTIECGDSCFATIKLDSGEEITYYAGGDVQDFNGVPGTRVRLSYDIEQFYDEEFNPPCVKAEVFQTISVVK
jgi:hypothetical protein